MKSLAEQMAAYGKYHRDARNKLTHFVGVPLVTFAIFVFLGWLRFAHAPEIPFTGATLFYLLVCLYYLCLSWTIALLQAPFSLSCGSRIRSRSGPFRNRCWCSLPPF
jgi:uncharacterized membrane protein YGL010W